MARPINLPPTTTAQEDLTTHGQRKVNLIWEYTQAAIAIMVTAVFVYAEVSKIESTSLKMAFTLVIGFYFSRTNHSAIGGVGKKPAAQYQGR